MFEPVLMTTTKEIRSMKLKLFALATLFAAVAAHADTTSQYQESYDADGNRTWTKFKTDAPVPTDYRLRDLRSESGSTTTQSSLLSFPIIGIDQPVQGDTSSQPFYFDADGLSE